MEKLFTNEQLAAIEKEAVDDIDIYLGGHVITGDKTGTTIITVSVINQLIFTEGNEHTGFRHLNERHSFFSTHNYWVGNDQGGLRVDDPSKFNRQMMPIVDYVNIADAIFSSENKNVTKNNHPDLFDKYTGIFQFQDGGSEKYHLLTYKDTRIVHSLFPDKKVHNRKRKLKLVRGTVTSSLKFPDGFNDLEVPYEDSNGVTVYSIFLRKELATATEYAFIRKHDDNGVPLHYYVLGQRAIEPQERFEYEDIHYFQFADLPDFEQMINELNNASGSLVI